MQIECLLRRAGGTVVKLGGKEYHFKPETADGAHLCDITEKAHLKTLLAVPEAYSLYLPDEDADQTEPVDPDPDPQDDDQDDGEGDDEGEDDFEEDGVDPDAEDVGDDDTAEDEEDEDGDADHMSLEELLADPDLIEVEDVKRAKDADIDHLFHAVIGKPPHPNMKIETRRTKLIEEIEKRG